MDLAALLKNTLKKMSDKELLYSECEQLELVPPAPGRPELQHDTMVAKGLCKKAEKHEKKNRYCNQYPFDEFIVEAEGVDYINASWIKSPDEEDFVITIGPLHPRDFGHGRKSDFNADHVPDTCGDFWHMCWHVDAKVVVMLCTLQPGYQGCSEYFPQQDGETRHFGKHFKVTMSENAVEENGFVVRKFLMEKSGEGSKSIRHFQYLMWPNYGVPEGVEELARMTRKVDKAIDDHATKTRAVVHCSGGLGRSGTFLASLVTYRMIKKASRGLLSHKQTDTHFPKTTVNLSPLVRDFRIRRHPWMVEGIAQYGVAYKVITKLIQQDLNS